MASDAYKRLAYGVFPPCPKCRCSLIDVHGGNPPKCLRCCDVRLTATEQVMSRPVAPMETDWRRHIVDRDLMTPDDGGDQSHLGMMDG